MTSFVSRSHFYAIIPIIHKRYYGFKCGVMGLNRVEIPEFKSRVESITDAIYELEVPTEFSGR